MTKSNIFDPLLLSWTRAATEEKISCRVQQKKYSVTNDNWHRHDGFWEAVLVLAGKAVNEMENDRIFLRSGDFFVMPPGSLHRYVSMKNFQYYLLLFKPEFLEKIPGNFFSLPNARKLFQNARPGSPLLHLAEEDMPEAIRKLENAQQEYLFREPGYLEAFYAETALALIFLLRKAAPPGQHSSFLSWQIGRAIRHMEENMRQELTLKTLSAVAKMSVSTFRFQFRKVTGFSPIDYLIRLRLRQAAILLAYTDQPVTEIIQQTGFGDGSYFARQFRSVFGRTARQFREEVQAGRIQTTEEFARVLRNDDNGKEPAE